MSISAKQVMDLRAATGMPMMKCKKALEAEGGDYEKAFDRLRKEGMKAADKRADRATAEGLVRVRIDDDHKRGTAVAVVCETEPVSKLPMFVEFVDQLAEQVVAKQPASVEELLAQPWILDESQTVEEVRRGLIAKINENIQIQDVANFAVDGEGLVGTYVHFTNKDAAVVTLKSSASADELGEFAKSLCMHIVFAKPTVMDRADVPQDLQDKEREIAIAQIQQDPKMANKPEQVVAKISEGKMDAFFRSIVLPEQEWAVDPSKKASVADMLRENGAEVVSFRRFHIG